jgi:F-type H+-transporting ATPase subunit a
MADPVLHISDGYFFEVPKFLWPRHYKSLDEVKKDKILAKLIAGHEHVTVEQVNHDLSGKIIIPQPFGEIKNLYEKESGFCISRFMVIELVVAIVLVVVFTRAAKKIATGDTPRGLMWNLIEAFLSFMRDEVIRPAIGKHDADKFVPLLWTVFFFILGCNLMGMIPWVGTPMGAWGATFAMACVTLLTIFIAGMAKFGFFGFWANQLPHMDMPWYMAIVLKPAIWLIEVVGLLIRNGILSVRLLANMVAGHLVLLGILGMIVGAAQAGAAVFTTVAVIGVAGSAAFSLLELFVAFLQAYIFTFLSALFIGAAVHHH